MNATILFMDALLDFGLEATRWLQATYPQLEGFFQFITALGTQEFYLIFFPFIYWAVDKRLGIRVSYLFLITIGINLLAKQLFRGPRPYWLDDSVRLTEIGYYGVPSGHVQITAVVMTLFATWVKQRWLTILAIFLIISMSFSRVYLGAHFVHDVLAGLLLAAFLLVGYALWQSRLDTAFSKRIMGQRLLVVLLIPFIYIAVYALIRFMIGEPNYNVAWSQTFIDAAELEILEDVATTFGALLGFGVGVIFESTRVRFRSEGSLWQRALRYIIGIVGAILIWGGLREVFSTVDILWLALPLRALRYFLTLIWIAYYAPVIFVRSGLAQAEPDRGIQMDL